MLYLIIKSALWGGLAYWIVSQIFAYLMRLKPALVTPEIEKDGWRHYLPLFPCVEAIPTVPLMIAFWCISNGLEHYGVALCFAAMAFGFIAFFVSVSLWRRYPMVCPECSDFLMMGPTPIRCRQCGFSPSHREKEYACV
jgi:hypothetical protein